MTAPRSLRRDLALGLGAGVVLLWLLAMLGSWAILRQEMNEIYDAALARTADRILQLPPAEFPVPQPGRPTAEDLSYLFRNADGTLLMRSPGGDPAIFGERPRAGFRDHADHRVFGRDLGDGSFLEVADPLAERRDATLDALVTLLVPAALLAPVIFLGVGRIVDARLRPVARLAGQVALRDSGDLRTVATPDLQVEFLPIEEAINRLMERLADALTAERSFSANAAHELRTPIAATLAHTQRLIAEAPDGPLRDRARAIERELKRMTRLSEKLLDLSRAEAAGVASGSALDLRTVLSLVVADFRPAAPDLGLTMPAFPVASTIDPDAFAILARNLIENAVVHGRPPVVVTLDRHGTLEVSNDGPTLDPDSLARLTRRFERLGSQRKGSGIGLAIVEALVENANARLEFRSPATGRPGGLSALVALPPRSS
jgi:two-component system OmpR family sensor kinase